MLNNAYCARYLQWISHFVLPSQVIGTIAGVTYLLDRDRDGKFRNRFADSGDHILSKHPVLFYYCVGKFIFCWVAWNVGLHRFVLVNSVSLVAVNSLMTNVFETVFLFTEDRVLYSNENSTCHVTRLLMLPSS